MIKNSPKSTHSAMMVCIEIFKQHRILRHVTFWLLYYVFFSVIWMKPHLGYFPSFYLEFILLPIRIMAAYTMMYWLIPHYLVTKRFKQFALGYLLLIFLAGGLQRIFDHFFYQQLMLNITGELFSVSSVMRSIILVNTTVMLAMVFKVFQLFLEAQDKVVQLQLECDHLKNGEKHIMTLKSNRRIHHVDVKDIFYIEGMGNYISYHLKSGEHLIVYSSIKACLSELPKQFIRLNRSAVVNVDHIQSYNNENITINGQTISRGANVTDDMLSPT